MLDRAVAAFAGGGWGWTVGELEGLVTAAGWVYRAPLEGTVSCEFDAVPGRAGAFLFRDEVTAVYLIIKQRAGTAVLARRDEFVAAIDQVAELLGPPASRCPGPDPSVGWRVAAGALEIVDRPGALDLWLRPAPKPAPRTIGSPERTGAHGSADVHGSTEDLAAAAAILPLGGVLRLLDGTEPVAELRQAEDHLTVHTGGGRTEILQWPAAGGAYRRMIVDLGSGR
ncbi:DUF6301 family protein [Actinoplanes italicus]|uniref:DUF6301 family protein n=1 Tax=Actinoplanes italicus TaxID=113567 RepID=UPI0011B1D4FA|nr:DUF6301 family protein [Actinoplanes italicus]